VNSHLRTSEEAGRFAIERRDNGETVASVEEKEWDSEFFGKKIGSLAIDHHQLSGLPVDSVLQSMRRLVRWTDEHGFDLTEASLDASGIQFVPVLESCGYRLVDTKITFLSLLNKDELPEYPSVPGEIRFATEDDLEDILRLTHEGFTHNPSFTSRYANRAYFTEKETTRYYTAWIRNHLETDGSFFVVWTVNDELVGYYIYRREGDEGGTATYKGILCTIAPEARGHKGHLAMQAFLYEFLPDEKFLLNNTTQLNNYAVIKNHIFSQKKLERIELLFFRECG
jgi:hypothetical protein